MFGNSLRDAIGYYRDIGREATLILLASSVGAFWWGVYIVIPSVFFPQVGLSDAQAGSLYSAKGLTSAIVGIPPAIPAVLLIIARGEANWSLRSNHGKSQKTEE